MGHTSEKAPEQQTNDVNKSSGNDYMTKWWWKTEKNPADDIFKDYPLYPWLMKQRRHWVNIPNGFCVENEIDNAMFTYFEYG